MPNLLNGVASGAGPGPSNLTIIRGGRYDKTVVTNVPGAEVNTADGIPSNLAAYMGGIFHSALTSVWASAPDNGTQTPVWTTRNSERVAGLDTQRCGFYPCMTTQGPGLVTAWVNPVTGATRMARWDYLTDAITLFDQPSGIEFDGQELGAGIVVGNLFFIGGKDASSHLTHVFNIENGAFALDTVFGGYSIMPFATLNGNVYVGGRNGSNFPTIYVWLGGQWVAVASDTAVGQNIGAPTSGVTGMLFYARKGKLYLGTKKNAGNGLSLWEFDPGVPGVLTEVTGIVDGTLAAPTPGITTATLNLTYGFYVDVDTLASPRYMIQVVTDRKTASPGVALYEHTDAGLELIGDTALAMGTNCLTQAPYSVAGLIFTEGGLWGLKIASATPHPQGMLLTYRFGGDPGNADSVIRIARASPLGAPDVRAGKLVAPAGGLGQVGASLVDEGGGVFRIDGWDANGVDNLTVVHETLADGVLNGVLTDWHFKIGKA